MSTHPEQNENTREQEQDEPLLPFDLPDPATITPIPVPAEHAAPPPPPPTQQTTQGEGPAEPMPSRQKPAERKALAQTETHAAAHSAPPSSTPPGKPKRKPPRQKGPGGRYKGSGPKSHYTPLIGRNFCELIASGLTVRQAAEELKHGDRTVWRWMWWHPEFHDAYLRARKLRLSVRAEQCLDIADDIEEDPKSRDIRIKTRQWEMARLDHQTWGERKDVNQTNVASVAAMTVEERLKLADEVLEQLKVIAAPVLDRRRRAAEAIEAPVIDAEPNPAPHRPGSLRNGGIGR